MKNAKYKKLLSGLSREDAQSNLTLLASKSGINPSEFRVTGRKLFSVWISIKAWEDFFSA